MRTRLAVQLRWKTGLTSEDYVTQQAWLSATLLQCPAHPAGGCGIAGHGAYERRNPAGVWIPRWYCREAHLTVSLLPDFVASRLSSSLEEVEDVAAAVEAAPSLEAAASELRPDIQLPGAVKWTRRRVNAVRVTLTVMVGLLPAVLAGVELSIRCFRAALRAEPVLIALRELAATHLPALPPPVGFGPRPKPRNRRGKATQQGPGPDPPGPAT